MRNVAFFVLAPLLASAQTVPVYRVTVVERSLRAVNYQYRAGPTEIDFKGTVLLPYAKGHATVESHRGRVEITANFKKLEPPTPFGREFLTYVLWAISPEGAPHNICEIVPNGSDDAKVHVSTELQAFAMIVTAEPYSTVRQPSDVVVMENEVRPDTIGKIETIEAKTELLPRGHYTLDKQANPPDPNAPKVSMSEYEQLSQIYQAENALSMARAGHADTLAAETFAKAEQLLAQARQQRANKEGTSFVVQTAREASQTADDARLIAEKRAREQTVLAAQNEAARARDEKAQALADAQIARAEAEAARAHAEDERAARLRAEAVAAQTAANQLTSSKPAYPPPAAAPVRVLPAPAASQIKTQTRIALATQLNGILVTRDTPRGLVAVVLDAAFTGGSIRPETAASLTRLAAVLSSPAYAGLRVSIEGYSDSASGSSASWARAEAVKDMLAGRSYPVTSQGLGAARPLTSNATEAGRQENRRVEIVVTGDAIGDDPVWNRGYNLNTR